MLEDLLYFVSKITWCYLLTRRNILAHYLILINCKAEWGRTPVTNNQTSCCSLDITATNETCVSIIRSLMIHCSNEVQRCSQSVSTGSRSRSLLGPCSSSQSSSPSPSQSLSPSPGSPRACTNSESKTRAPVTHAACTYIFISCLIGDETWFRSSTGIEYTIAIRIRRLEGRLRH